MSRELLDLAHAALAAAMACSAAKAHVPGDVTEEHEDNTFGLPDGVPIRKEMRRKFRDQLKRMVGFVSTIGDELPTVFPKCRDYNEAMAASMTPILGTYWDKAGKGLRSRMGLDPDEWRVTDPNVHRAIADQAFKFCKKTNDTTDLGIAEATDAIRDQLARGLIGQGETIPELTKRVKSVFARASTSRASTIARTEAARAVHSAAEMSAQGTGLGLEKHWLLSANSCPVCVALAAKAPKAALGASFGTVGRDPTYSDVKMPPAHPNCRCSVTFEVAESAADDDAGEEAPQAPVPAFVPPPRKPKPVLPTAKPPEAPRRIPAGPIGERIEAYRQGAGKAKLDRLAGLEDTYQADLEDLDKSRAAAKRSLERLLKKGGTNPEAIAAARATAAELLDRRIAFDSEKKATAIRAADALAIPHGARATIACVMAAGGIAKPAEWKAGEEWLGRVLADDPAGPIAIDYKVLDPGGRACHQAHSKSISLTIANPADVAVHELGHAIEAQWPGVGKLALEFLDHRTGGDKLEHLAKLFPGRKFEAHEVGRSDHFGRAFDDDPAAAYYCGKEYKLHPNYHLRTGSEILAMGLQKLMVDPVGFARKDPEYCAFVLGILDGHLR